MLDNLQEISLDHLFDYEGACYIIPVSYAMLRIINQDEGMAGDLVALGDFQEWLDFYEGYGLLVQGTELQDCGFIKPVRVYKKESIDFYHVPDDVNELRLEDGRVYFKHVVGYVRNNGRTI